MVKAATASLVVAVVVAGCGATSKPRSQGPPSRVLSAAAEHVRLAEVREIRLVSDRHMVGPPRAQSVRVECPAAKAQAVEQGFSLRCNASLFLAVVPGDLAVWDEDWRVRTDAAGQVKQAAPVNGYEIRAFFELDDVKNCSGALAQVTAGQAGDLQAISDAAGPCLP